MHDMTTAQWIWVISTAIAIGFSKMGIGAVTTMVIPLLAGVFGGKESTGILLPILLAGDIMAVCYYRRNANWKAILRLLPWTLAGLTVGAVVGNMMSDDVFKLVLGIMVLACTALLVYTEARGNGMKVPDAPCFFILMGVIAGFTTMLGNAAGPIMSVYLLAMGYQKVDFIGTYAWFFMIINAIKLPMQVFLWHNVTVQHGLLTLTVLPAIALGAFIGIWVVKRIPEKPFRWVVVVMTGLSAIRLFF